jgi:hypothetical protein
MIIEALLTNGPAAAHLTGYYEGRMMVPASQGEDQDMRDRMTRVETKLDALITTLAAQHPDHEARIRNLEAKIWWLAGFAAAPGMIALLSKLAEG